MDGAVSTRIERKYVFTEESAVLAWLEHCLLPDPLHPFGTVRSIYYDTPALDRYHEKRNGDRVKWKVRLRWYDGESAEWHGESLDCYLETKRREGSLSHKQRVGVSLPRAVLRDPFAAEVLQDLPRLHAHTALVEARALVPMLLVCYERRRFADPRTRGRVSVDTRIRCEGVNRTYLAPRSTEPLEAGVLEIKGRELEGPPWLRELGGHVLRRSFSKYAECVDRRIQR